MGIEEKDRPSLESLEGASTVRVQVVGVGRGRRWWGWIGGCLWWKGRESSRINQLMRVQRAGDGRGKGGLI